MPNGYLILLLPSLISYDLIFPFNVHFIVDSLLLLIKTIQVVRKMWTLSFQLVLAFFFNNMYVFVAEDRSWEHEEPSEHRRQEESRSEEQRTDRDRRPATAAARYVPTLSFCVGGYSTPHLLLFVRLFSFCSRPSTYRYEWHWGFALATVRELI